MGEGDRRRRRRRRQPLISFLLPPPIKPVTKGKVFAPARTKWENGNKGAGKRKKERGRGMEDDFGLFPVLFSPSGLVL